MLSYETKQNTTEKKGKNEKGFASFYFLLNRNSQINLFMILVYANMKSSNLCLLVVHNHLRNAY
jgi:hypothetical protein